MAIKNTRAAFNDSCSSAAAAHIANQMHKKPGRLVTALVVDAGQTTRFNITPMPEQIFVST